MKVYVMTKAKFMQPEIYIGVKAKRKDAEKALRKEFPYMKPDGNGNFSVGKTAKDLVCLFIHEEEI